MSDSRPRKRYRITLEELSHDGRVVRSLMEESEKLKDDFADGEVTVGMLLEKAMFWIGASVTGSEGLATLASLCLHIPAVASEPLQIFKRLGEAYEKWGATHDFHSCIELAINQERLECNEVECNHGD